MHLESYGPRHFVNWPLFVSSLHANAKLVQESVDLVWIILLPM